MDFKIDIPFGAKDSELKGWEYTIPEGMEAIIKDGKVIVKEKASEDERIRRQLINVCNDYLNGDYSAKPCLNDIKWLKNLLEKQKEQKPAECEEDERIRKWMINQLSAVINTESAKEFDPAGYEMAIKALSWLEKQKINTEGDFGRGYDCGYEACLNSHGAEWFEKQKEKSEKLTIPEKENEAMKAIESIIRVYGKTQGEWIAGYDMDTLVVHLRKAFAALEKQKELPFVKDVMLGYSGLYFYDGERMHFRGNPAMEEKQKEQKPAEWSEEDREMLMRCVAAIPVQGDEIMPTSYLNKLRNWLESIPERFNLQPKPEWSEKDDEIRKALIAFLEMNTGYFACNGFTKDDIIQWLKSLRHQPKQELSEEDKTNGWTGVDLERYLSCLQKLGTGNPQQPETINSKWFKEHCRPLY